MAHLWYLGASSCTTARGRERYTPRHRESLLLCLRFRIVFMFGSRWKRCPFFYNNKCSWQPPLSHWEKTKSTRFHPRYCGLRPFFRGFVGWSCDVFFMFRGFYSITQILEAKLSQNNLIILHQIRETRGYNKMHLRDIGSTCRALCLLCLNWIISHFRWCLKWVSCKTLISCDLP